MYSGQHQVDLLRILLGQLCADYGTGYSRGSLAHADDVRHQIMLPARSYAHHVSRLKPSRFQGGYFIDCFLVMWARRCCCKEQRTFVRSSTGTATVACVAT
jgi:hypothetical protein